MVTLAEKPTPVAIESDARSVWAGQRLPPVQGPLGPADGPVVRQFLGGFVAQENGTLVAQRAVAADVDARAMMLAGRRAQGTLRLEDGGPPTDAPRLEPALAALGVWVGGAAGRAWDADPRRAGVQTLVGRLAHMGALAVRDVSLRICPACAVARSPELIVYQEEDGETLLVRFPFVDGDRTVAALVWTDAAWRLLGTSALMVHPDVAYVIARYRRKGAEELVFTSKSSLERIRRWLPGSEVEVLEEHPGRHWEGRVYDHPLRHEFPMGGEMEPPCGTIVPVTDVSDTGTGVVPLIPGHGGTDTQIADRLRLPGWPLVTPKGRFDILFVHKYAGLELDSGNEFVARDLEEGGAIFARLRVRRGVPHCVRCGTALIWAPGRAWCLEPSRLPAEKVALYRSLLPKDRPIERLEVVPWPVSEPQRSDDSMSVALLECSSCDRLDSVENAAARCVCGGRRRAIRRRLLSAFDAAASAWAGVDPFAPSDAARLYVNERRRAPTLVHYIAAMSGVAGNVGDVRLTMLPTVPEQELPALVARYGADAVRAAFVRAQGSEGATATFTERCAQEARRLGAFWDTARRVLLPVDSAALVLYAQPITGSLGELLPEDRALLARYERMRVQATVDYDRSSPAVVHRRLFAFLENDLEQYLDWVAPRLAEAGAPPSRRVALHTLVHVLFGAAELLGPIAPFTAESVHRALRRSRASLFQEPPVGVDRTLLDPTRAKAWDRWLSVARALHRFRRSMGLSPATVVPSATVVVDSDPVADEYRAEASTIERLARVGKLEVGSPGAPWAGRRRQLKPREAEIQRVYSSRAAQIIHLLRRMPERKGTDATSGQGFSVTVNGQPTQILPSMVEWTETLPDRFVPVEWAGGELYASLPTGVPIPESPLPPLSRDGLEVVARVRHRLRGAAAPPPAVVIIAAPPALAADLSPALVSIARHLGVSDVRLVRSDAELPGHGRAHGRTRAGARWSFHLSTSVGPGREPKQRPARARGARVRPAYAPADLLPTVRNYADAEWIAREAAVRALGEELDQLVGAPLLGPAKSSIGWDAGLHDVAAYRAASWETLAGLPGFGRPIASALVAKFGGTIPPAPTSAERRAALGVLPWTQRAATPSEISIASSSGPADSATPGRPEIDVPIVSTPPVARGPPTMRKLESDRGPPPPHAPAESPPLPSPPPAARPSREPEDEARETPVARPPPELPIATAAESSMAPTDGGPVPDTLEPAGVELAAPPATPPPSPAAADERSSLPSAGEVADPVDETPDRPQLEIEPPAPASETSPPDPNVVPPAAASEEAIPVEVSPSSRVGTPEAPVEAEAIPPTTPAEPIPEALSEPAPTVEVPTEQPSAQTSTPEPPTRAPVDAPETMEVATETAPPVPEAEGPEIPSEPTLSPGTSPNEIPAPPVGSGSTGGDGAPPARDEESRANASSPEPPPPPLSPAEPPAAPPSAPTGPPTLVPPTALESSVAGTPPFPVVEPPLAPAPPPAPAEPVAASGIDLAVGPSYFPSLERFLEATSAGHQGICVVRDSPERIRAYVGSRPVEIRWLTNIGRGPTLKPTDLDGFSAFLAHAVSAEHVTAFFLEGVEYLVRLHGLERVVDRMAAFDRLAREHAARVWMPLNPKLLSGPELERFVARFGAAAGPDVTPPE